MRSTRSSVVRALILPPPNCGIHEGAQPDVGEGPGLAGGDVPEQVGDDALGQVVGLHLVGQGQGLDLGGEAQMAADDPAQQAFVAEMVQPPVLAIPLPRREDEGQVPGRSGLQEPPLQGDGQVLGEPVAHETAGGQRVAVPDAGHRLGGAGDLVPPGRKDRYSRLGWHARLLMNGMMIFRSKPDAKQLSSLLFRKKKQ